MTVLCILCVARVVPDTVHGAVDPVVRVLCVVEEEKMHKKEKKEKKKHNTRGTLLDNPEQHARPHPPRFQGVAQHRPPSPLSHSMKRPWLRVDGAPA